MLNSLKKNKFCYCIFAAIRGLKEDDFYQDLVGIKQNINLVHIDEKGKMHKGKLLYDLELKDKRFGFFALMRTVLSALDFADGIGAQPYVRFPSGSLYTEDSAINGTYNAFEYYYNPVSDIRQKDVENGYRVIKYQEKQGRGLFNSYEEYFQQVARLAEIYSKYIRLNSNTEKYLEREISNVISGKRTLGVHIRGTDYKGGYRNHPVAVMLDEYIAEIDKAMETEQYDQVFVATDEQNTIDVINERYGDRTVFFCDVFRSLDGNAVHTSKSDRPQHKYKLGLEVMRDAYCLARCDGLIAGISNVSLFAQIIKKSENGNYSYIKILNKGINKNEKGFNIAK